MNWSALTLLTLSALAFGVSTVSAGGAGGLATEVCVDLWVLAGALILPVDSIQDRLMSDIRKKP